MNLLIFNCGIPSFHLGTLPCKLQVLEHYHHSYYAKPYYRPLLCAGAVNFEIKDADGQPLFLGLWERGCCGAGANGVSVQILGADGETPTGGQISMRPSLQSFAPVINVTFPPNIDVGTKSLFVGVALGINRLAYPPGPRASGSGRSLRRGKRGRRGRR